MTEEKKKKELDSIDYIFLMLTGTFKKWIKRSHIVSGQFSLVLPIMTLTIFRSTGRSGSL